MTAAIDAARRAATMSDAGNSLARFSRSGAAAQGRGKSETRHLPMQVVQSRLRGDTARVARLLHDAVIGRRCRPQCRRGAARLVRKAPCLVAARRAAPLSRNSVARPARDTTPATVRRHGSRVAACARGPFGGRRAWI